MRLTSRLLVNLLTVLALGIVTVGWVLFSLVGGGAFADPVRVTADFAASGGVFTNQEVTYRGVLVGKVGDLSLNPTGVDIELLIDPEWAGDIPADVRAAVQSKSAVGEQFVNLTPLSAGGPALTDGDVIPRERTRLPVDFQALLTSLDRVLADVPPGKARRLIRNLAGGLGGRAEEIGTILGSLGDLSRTFASIGPEQRRLLPNATRAGAAFLATKDELARAIRAADAVFAGIGDEPEELRALLANNDALAREGLALLDRHAEDLHEGIRALADLTDYQLSIRTEVVKTLDYLPDFLRAVEESAIPWRDPDGNTFYRIRAGLVFDNVEATWPCKYVLPEDYERHYFERKERDPVTTMRCRPRETTSDPTALVTALRSYVAESEAIDGGVPVAGDDLGRGLTWPLQGAVTSPFGPRDGGAHEGIDIDGATGDPVVAAAPGTVVHAGPYYGYGNLVVLQHAGGMQTLYAHLDRIDAAPGRQVLRGEALGTVGCTGTCTGPHLHFEVHVNGLPVNPLLWLPGGPLPIAHT